MPRRYRGAFTGRTRPDDLFNNGVLDTMGCCAAAGGQGLSRLWENAVDEEAGEARVNLWTSRTGALVAVSAPDRGTSLSIRALKDCRLTVRAPGLPPAATVRVQVNGREHAVQPAADLLPIGALHAGAVVEVRPDIREAREHHRVAGDDYDVTWRGNVIAGLAKRPAAMPLYPEAR